MSETSDAPITITAFNWVPVFARGQVRDLRVRWALEEAGRDYRVDYLDQGQQKSAGNVRRQPFAQVPTYQEGELTLFETGAILLHVAMQSPALLPDGEHAVARANQWLFAALNSIEPHLSELAMATLFEADKDWSKPRIPGIRKRIASRLDRLSERLGEDEWLEGGFSIADVMMVTVLRIVEDDTRDLFEARPNLAAYRARGQARPAFRRALDAQMAGFTAKAPPGLEHLDG